MRSGNQVASNDITLSSPESIPGVMYSPEFEDIICNTRKKKILKGESLFLQGSAVNEIFFITVGRIKLNKVFEDGNELTLEMRKPGDFVGEYIFLPHAQCPVSAYCMEDTTTCGFSKNEFERLILDYPRIGLQVIRNMSERISWLSRRIKSLALPNIEDRLLHMLVNMAREHGTRSPQGIKIDFPLTHEELSMLTGAHRVSVTRAMNALKRTGKIVYEDRHLVLPLLDGEHSAGPTGSHREREGRFPVDAAHKGEVGERC